MNKSDLIEGMARRAGIAPAGARAALEALFGNGAESGLIAAALGAGERVQLAGFGTFEVRDRKERLGRDPRSREPIVIPGGRTPAFRPGAALRAQVRGALRQGAGPG